MKIKRILALLILIFVVSGCQSEKQVEKLSFSITESDLFPFYTVDNEGILWKIENDGGVSLKDKVDYTIGGETKFFTKQLDSERLIYATDLRTENGKIFCTFKEQKGDENPTVIFENGDFDSVRVDNDGNIIFLDKEKNLYLRRKEMLNTVATNVAQAEFNNDGLLIYRTDEKNQNGTYPVYSLDGENLTYLTDGEKLLHSFDGNTYILNGIHNLQRRTATVQVATCSCVFSGEARYEIKNAVLSQFENRICGNYLLCVDETEVLLRYKVLHFSSQGENSDEPQEIIKNVTAGKALDENLFFCQKDEAGKTVSYLLKGENSLLLSVNYDLNKIYTANGKLLAVYDNKIFDVEKGECVSAIENVNTFVENNGYYMYSAEKAPSYNFAVVLDNNEETFFLQNVASTVIKKYGNRIFYLTGENNQLDLCMYDISQKSITAITSNADEKIGFLCGENTVAVSKSDGGTLFIVSTQKMIDCGLKISRFV